MAVVGPATNLVIARARATVTLTALGEPIAPTFPFAPPEAAQQLTAIGCLSWLAWMNGVLAAAAAFPPIRSTALDRHAAHPTTAR